MLTASKGSAHVFFSFLRNRRNTIVPRSAFDVTLTIVFCPFSIIGSASFALKSCYVIRDKEIWIPSTISLIKMTQWYILWYNFNFLNFYILFWSENLLLMSEDLCMCRVQLLDCGCLCKIKISYFFYNVKHISCVFRNRIWYLIKISYKCIDFGGLIIIFNA